MRALSSAIPVCTVWKAVCAVCVIDVVRWSCEAFVPGEYKKHNNNSGYVGNATMGGGNQPDAGVIRKTPQAFSHFTYEHTKGKVMVTDIQVSALVGVSTCVSLYHTQRSSAWCLWLVLPSPGRCGPLH